MLGASVAGHLTAPAFAPALAPGFATGLVPAHGVGSRQDLPLPFTALVIGASVALVASFLGLAVLWREPRLSADDGWRLPAGLQSFLESAGLRRAGRVVIGLVTLWFLLSLVFGVDDANNPVPYVVFVWLWVGMPFVSLLLGGWWGTVNPMRLLHRALTWVARIPDSPLVSRATLERIGLWPAAVGVFAFTWLELIADDRATLRVLRVWIGFFVLVSIIGSLLLGSRWFRQGDPFEVLSGSTASCPRWGAVPTATGCCAPPSTAQPCWPPRPACSPRQQ